MIQLSHLHVSGGGPTSRERAAAAGCEEAPKTQEIAGEMIRYMYVPVPRHLVDFKTIYAGGSVYREPRARDDQSGAVALRAHRVHPAYERAAGGLDTRFYTAPLTPVMDRLN